MKNTQKPELGGLEELSPELNQLRSELSALIDRFDELSSRTPEGISFCVLTAISFCSIGSHEVKTSTARISGGEKFALCFAASARRLKEKNAPLFEIV